MAPTPRVGPYFFLVYFYAYLQTTDLGLDSRGCGPSYQPSRSTCQSLVLPVSLARTLRGTKVIFLLIYLDLSCVGVRFREAPLLWVPQHLCSLCIILYLSMSVRVFALISFSVCAGSDVSWFCKPGSTRGQMLIL